MAIVRRLAPAVTAAIGLAAGCALPPPPPMADPLPVLPVDEVAEDPGYVGVATVPAEPRGDLRVTFSAVDAPLREMIPLLAEAAGLSVVVEPEVEGLVTVHFEDVSALEAFELVVREAGYEVRETGGTTLPFVPRTVFFVPAVDVDRASAAEIRARFGTSPELAEWIVTTRVGG